MTGKLDYNINTRHAVSGTYAHNRDNSDRPDASNNYGLVPAVTNPTHADLVALSWRWTPGATLTNEVRGGFNLTYGYFLNADGNVPDIVTPPPGHALSPIRSTSVRRRAGPPTLTTCPTTRRGSMDGTTFSSASTCSTSAWNRTMRRV